MKNYILVDCKNFSLYSSGISAYFKPFLNSLISHFNDYHFILVAPNEFDTYFIEELNNWELRIIPRVTFFSSSIEVIFYDLWTFPRGINKVNACLLISPYYDFVIPANFKNKTIITVHDLCYWEVGELYPMRIRYYYKLLLNFNINRAKYIITVSQSSLNSIINFFGQSLLSKLVVIYNTFEISNYKIKEVVNDKNKKILLYTGGFEYRKNVDNLFKALAELKYEVDFQLLFTGNYILNVKLLGLIKKYQLENYVKLTGSLSTEELHRSYNLCDTVINTSFCEGFGRSNLEAMYFNKPLVCSELDVFKELVGNYAIYCDPYSVISIKEAILKSFDNTNRTIETRGIEKFSFKPNKTKFINTVENILNEN